MELLSILEYVFLLKKSYCSGHRLLLRNKTRLCSSSNQTDEEGSNWVGGILHVEFGQRLRINIGNSIFRVIIYFYHFLTVLNVLKTFLTKMSFQKDFSFIFL